MTRARSLSKLGNPAVFSVDTDNNVGVNSTVPKEKLNVVGVVSATSFFGDGTGLTGVASTDNIITGTAATFTNDVNISGITTVGVLTATQINVTGVTTGVTATFTGDVSVRNLTGVAATFTGVLTYEDVTNVDSVGLVTARSGLRVVGGGVTVTGVSTFFSDVSIADKIIHTGDTNTAIRFPAADTFTVETAGSERVRVDSSGNTGINCTSGGGKLAILANASTYEGLELQTPSGDGSGEFHIGVHQTGTSNGRSIVFKRGGADGMDTESLRINADGDVLPGADNGQDLGSTAKRWANIYSADLQLSNEGMSNDVDGTWGQYTIQEGENDLFLLNRRSGKKYKFMLEEV